MRNRGCEEWSVSEEWKVSEEWWGERGVEG